MSPLPFIAISFGENEGRAGPMLVPGFLVPVGTSFHQHGPTWMGAPIQPLPSAPCTHRGGSRRSPWLGPPNICDIPCPPVAPSQCDGSVRGSEEAGMNGPVRWRSRRTRMRPAERGGPRAPHPPRRCPLGTILIPQGALAHKTTFSSHGTDVIMRPKERLTYLAHR